MKRAGWGIMVVLLFISINASVAQIPRIISYQGRLLGTNEQPVPDGQYKLTFRIYDASNALLWTEIHNQIVIGGGLFNVFLGTITPIDLPFNQPYQLGIQVGSDPEFLPRIMLSSSAYSFSTWQLIGASNFIPADGNVGLGTLNPKQKLHVAGIGRFDVRTDSHIEISTPGGWPGIIAMTPGGHRRDIIYDDPNSGSGYKGGVRILASNSSAAPGEINGIIITEEGYLGVGTGYPAAKLDVDFGTTGAVRAGTPLGNGPGWIFLSPNGHRRDIVGDKNGVYIGASAGAGAADAAFQVSEAGNVGIGLPTSVPSNILTVVRNSSTDPIADSWSVYSSKRWKTNVKSIDNALEKVKRLRGVSFDWKADNKHDIGLIAEEVGRVVPEVVVYEKNSTDAKSVDYSRLVALLIEAIKIQQKEIDALKMRIK